MEIVWGGASNPEHNRMMADWCALQVWPGTQRRFGNCVTMGVIDGRELLAVVVYHNWQPEYGVIEVSGAATSSRWLTRRVLHEMYAYPFEVAKVQAVFQRNDPDDERLSRQLSAYGFQRYDIPRLRGRQKAEAIFVLTDDAWRSNRFNKRHPHGQEKQQPARAA